MEEYLFICGKFLLHSSCALRQLYPCYLAPLSDTCRNKFKVKPGGKIAEGGGVGVRAPGCVPRR